MERSEHALAQLVRPEWPPLRHVRRGWQALTAQEQDEVSARVEAVLARHAWGRQDRASLLDLFAFLAQVETIAIEIPLRVLPSAPDHLRPLLRRQLVDEVFHSVLFARLAHDLALPEAQPPPPLPSAERLLDRIRGEPDPAVGATLLNLVAEGWIENLFRHAGRWGVADAVFEAVLADEARHVEEALQHSAGMDPASAVRAVRTLEEGLLEVGAEPRVALALHALAGEDGHRALVDDLHARHREHLALVGLEPSEPWRRMEEVVQQATAAAREAGVQDAGRPLPIEDTPWRTAARRLWATPRDPTMQGAFDVPVGHVRRGLLTPVLVAAVGAAWARNPRLNRVLVGDRLWQLPHANVGVRVLLAPDELATVVVTQADRRSVGDIRRILAQGVERLRKVRGAQKERSIVPVPLDDALVARAGPSPAAFAVAVSNPGRFGVVSGAGALSGALAPSTDLTFGRRRRLPRWRGLLYLPAWHVSVGALQDHRVFDGAEAGLAMASIQEALSPPSVRQILRRPDTLPPEEEQTQDAVWSLATAALPPELRMLQAVGLGKFAPVAVGGALAGAGLGVGLYYLSQYIAGGAAAASGAAGAGAAGAGAAGGGGAGAGEAARGVGRSGPEAAAGLPSGAMPDAASPSRAQPTRAQPTRAPGAGAVGAAATAVGRRGRRRRGGKVPQAQDAAGPAPAAQGRRCAASTAAGAACRNPALTGSAFCWRHRDG